MNFVVATNPGLSYYTYKFSHLLALKELGD